MSLQAVVLVLLLLQVKHFIIEYTYPLYITNNSLYFWVVRNAIHSGLHGLISFGVLGYMFSYISVAVLIICVFECIIHYIIDYCKGKIVSKLNAQKVRGNRTNIDKVIGHITEVDDLLHNLTYIAMIWTLINT